MAVVFKKASVMKLCQTVRKFFQNFLKTDESYKGLNIKEIFTQNTNEFCRDTTLHGVKYLADKKLRPSERCFFGVAIITVLCIAIYLILRTYEKWATSPVIVGINPQPTFITNEPFPAVTICNLNQALNTKVANFSRNSPEYEMLQLLCKREGNATVVQSITNWSNLESFIINISQPCEAMLVDCRFGGLDYNCSHLFYPLVTDEGFCCVFNMLHPKFMYASHMPMSFHNTSNGTLHQPVDWYAEKGYPKDLPKYFYPQKVQGIGESLGLSVTLNVQQNDYYCSSSSSVGFKFSLHSPNQSPNIKETGVYVEPGKETKLRIQPEKVESELHLRSVHTKFRQCLFHSERKLKFFSHYTQRNCEMECIAEMSQKYCGCVSYFMPKVHANVTVCSINDIQCETKVRLRMDTSIKSCLDDCLPSCFDLNFHVDSFSTKLSHNGFDITNPRIENMDHRYVEENVAIVHMFFKENSYRSSIQTEFIGISDFLSNIGGLMGLFLGFSFLSIAELIYYAILRPFRSIQEHKKSKDNDYQHIETGLYRRSSSSKSKSMRQLSKTRHSYVFPASKLYKTQSKMFERKMPVPYLITDAFEKTRQNENIYMME